MSDTDPAIEPESGESYKVLFERLWVAYLALIKSVKDLQPENSGGE